MTTEKLLTRDQILQADDIEVESVEVPEWGGSVNVKSLTGEERDKFIQSLTRRKGKQVSTSMENMTSKLVALSVVNGDGSLLFSLADVKSLSKKSSAALTRVVEVAQRLSGLGDDDLEILAENFGETQSEDSGLD